RTAVRRRRASLRRGIRTLSRGAFIGTFVRPVILIIVWLWRRRRGLRRRLIGRRRRTVLALRILPAHHRGSGYTTATSAAPHAPAAALTGPFAGLSARLQRHLTAGLRTRALALRPRP